jgi:toxin ParE1/3/4
VAKPPTGLGAVLAPAARRDIKSILGWSEERFGKNAAVRYEALLIQAVRDIEADAARSGVVQRSYLPAGVFLYHLAFSRNRVAGETVRQPRHFLAFRVRAAHLEILRVLHDSRDLARHLTPE